MGPPPEPSHACCHLDGNNSNNEIENLTYMKRSHIQDRAALHGRRQCSPDEVEEIRKRRMQGENIQGPRGLAAEYNTTPTLISNIVLGKTYKACGGPISKSGEVGYQCKISDKDAITIFHRVKDEKEIQAEIAKEFNVHYSTISHICRGNRELTRELARAYEEEQVEAEKQRAEAKKSLFPNHY
jgi:hypothetical protein